MNTLMWDNPFTSQQLNILKSLDVMVIPPVQKTLVCGDVGAGAMAEVDQIVASVKNCLPPSHAFVNL